MSLNGVEWAVLHTLLNERNELEWVDPKERWDMKPQEIETVTEWMSRRIEELQAKKDLP